MGHLDEILRLTANAPNRYKGIDTPEGRALFGQIQELERRLTPLRYRNVDLETQLPDEAKLDAEELLYILDLLSCLSVGWVLRANGIRTHRKVEDLMPDVMQRKEQTIIEQALETEPV